MANIVTIITDAPKNQDRVVQLSIRNEREELDSRIQNVRPPGPSKMECLLGGSHEKHLGF